MAKKQTNDSKPSTTKKAPPKKKQTHAQIKEETKKRALEILELIEKGDSLRKSLKAKRMSSRTFFQFVDENPDFEKQYTRACELRGEMIFDEILEIADEASKDQTAFVGINYIHRAKLKIEARKWALSKMNPKKYGEKIEHDVKTDVTIKFK